MASRLISFLKRHRNALILSAGAAFLCVSLYLQWQSHVALQAQAASAYAGVLEHFGQAEADRLLPSSTNLLFSAMIAGGFVALALTQWARKAD